MGMKRGRDGARVAGGRGGLLLVWGVERKRGKMRVGDRSMGFKGFGPLGGSSGSGPIRLSGSDNGSMGWVWLRFWIGALQSSTYNSQ